MSAFDRLVRAERRRLDDSRHTLRSLQKFRRQLAQQAAELAERVAAPATDADADAEAMAELAERHRRLARSIALIDRQIESIGGEVKAGTNRLAALEQTKSGRSEGSGATSHRKR